MQTIAHFKNLSLSTGCQKVSLSLSLVPISIFFAIFSKLPPAL